LANPLQIVPPDQSLKMYEEAKKKGNPVAYKEFEGNRFYIITSKILR